MSHTQQDVIETLKSAKNLIAETGWTQGFYAKDAKGTKLSSTSKHATCFCSEGAIMRAARVLKTGSIDGQWVGLIDLIFGAEDYLENAYDGGMPVAAWNDAPTRTREEVLHTFSLAIQMAEGDLAESAAEVLPGTAANTSMGVQEVA